MKTRHHLSLVILLCAAFSAYAQDAMEPARVRLHHSLPWQKGVSLEIGTGLAPLHTLMFPSYTDERALAQKGQEVDKQQASFPVLSLSRVWRTGERTEWVLTGGASCCYCDLKQYGTFGIDPNGNPRYNLNESRPAGRIRSDISPTLTLRYRHLWNPWNAVVVYYDLGLGVGDFSGLLDVKVLPAWTPIGLRYGGDHFYVWLENTYSPIATLVHGGLGWRF